MPSRATLWAATPARLRPSNVQVALVGLVEAGEQVEQRRLARAVRADERGDRTPLDLEVLDVDGDQTAELPADLVGDEDRVGLGHAGRELDALEPSRGRCGLASAVTDRHLPAIAEDALWSEDHQEHERDTDEDQPDRSDLVDVDRHPVRHDAAGDRLAQRGVDELETTDEDDRAHDRTEHSTGCRRGSARRAR